MISRIVSLVVVLLSLSFLSSCTVSADVSDSEFELCLALVCEEHRPCQFLLSTEVCFSESSSLCENQECLEGEVCRFGSCLAPDPDGLVCEKDHDCDSNEVCVLGSCTELGDYLDSLL